MIISDEMKVLMMKNIEDGGLGKYSLPSSEKGLRAIVEKWSTSKQNLMDLFSKNPHWNPEKFYIAFDTTVDRDIDSMKVDSFFSWVYKNLPYGVKWTDSFANLKYYPQKNIDGYLAEVINRDYPDLKIVEGQKTSRAVNKILSSLGYKGRSYEQQFAKYADALSPLQIVRHTVISLNPNDYLLMSNGNSWSSCHTIDKHNNSGGYSGCRCSGTLSYMLDGTSFVFYQVDKEYTGDNLELQPKIIRQMFHYDNGVLIQGRLYPQCNDGKNSLYVPTRAVVQKVIADALGIPNLWRKKGGTDTCRDFSKSYGTHYRDYTYQSECNVSRIFELIPDGVDNRKVNIGTNPICPICGKEHSREEWLYCSSCGNHSGNGEVSGYYCADCGEWIDEDDVAWVGDDPYCRDCAEWCEHCEEWVRPGCTEYIPSTGENVCSHCREEYFITCEGCGEIHPIARMHEDVHENYYCLSCSERLLVEIDGEYIPKADLKTCPVCGCVHEGEEELCDNCKEEAEHER